MTSITRDEYKTYIRIKNKMLFKNAETQTDPEETSSELDILNKLNGKNSSIIIINPMDMQPKRYSRDSSSDEEDEDYCETETDKDDEELENEIINETSSDDTKTCCKSKKNKKRHASDEYDRDEYKYYKSLPKKIRTTIDEIEKEVSEVNIVTKPLRFKILESNMDLKLKSLAMTKLEQLYALDPSSSEFFKQKTYVENMCKIPIGKYKPLPISNRNNKDDISVFLDNIKKKLDETVYGHLEAKDQIIRLLAKWIANPDSKGLVIALNGPMGCGKTLLCKSIAEAIGLPMGFISLGGMASTDSSILLGHSQTYESSRWGKIIDVLMKAECMNPVIFFDELDKISTTRHGEEIVNVLIHMTDHTQNDSFHDRYYCDVDLDLSKCLLVFSYNHEDKINPILKDRITSISTSGYTNSDKINISRDYMLPRIYKDYALKPEDIIFDDETLYYIINFTAEEKGVRNLQRSLEEIISQVNLVKILDKPIIDDKKIKFPLRITNEIVDKFMTKKKKDDWPSAHIYL